MQLAGRPVRTAEARRISRNVGSVITWCPSGDYKHTDECLVHEEGRKQPYEPETKY